MKFRLHHAVLASAIVVGCALSPVRAPKNVLEQIEAAELSAQQLSASITSLTCTRFVEKRCVEPGKAFLPDKAIEYHDAVQRARGALKASLAIVTGQVGECLGEKRIQAACLASARAILAELERVVIEQGGTKP